MTEQKTIDALNSRFPGLKRSEFRGQTRIVVLPDNAYDVLKTLKEELGFDLLVDVTCVDYLQYPESAPDRFGLVYLLADSETNERITVRCYLSESKVSIASITPLWEGANWLEREVFDMFGLRFVGHPDLRRVLLPPEFSGHPLRKDYPLQGKGERHNFPVVTRADG